MSEKCESLEDRVRRCQARMLHSNFPPSLLTRPNASNYPRGQPRKTWLRNVSPTCGAGRLASSLNVFFLTPTFNLIPSIHSRIFMRKQARFSYYDFPTDQIIFIFVIIDVPSPEHGHEGMGDTIIRGSVIDIRYSQQSFHTSSNRSLSE